MNGCFLKVLDSSHHAHNCFGIQLADNCLIDSFRGIVDAVSKYETFVHDDPA